MLHRNVPNFTIFIVCNFCGCPKRSVTDSKAKCPLEIPTENSFSHFLFVGLGVVDSGSYKQHLDGRSTWCFQVGSLQYPLADTFRDYPYSTKVTLLSTGFAFPFTACDSSVSTPLTAFYSATPPLYTDFKPNRFTEYEMFPFSYEFPSWRQDNVWRVWRILHYDRTETTSDCWEVVIVAKAKWEWLVTTEISGLTLLVDSQPAYVCVFPHVQAEIIEWKRLAIFNWYTSDTSTTRSSPHWFFFPKFTPGVDLQETKNPFIPSVLGCSTISPVASSMYQACVNTARAWEDSFVLAHPTFTQVDEHNFTNVPFPRIPDVLPDYITAYPSAVLQNEAWNTYLYPYFKDQIDGSRLWFQAVSMAGKFPVAPVIKVQKNSSDEESKLKP